MYVSHALTNKASWFGSVDPKLNLQLELESRWFLFNHRTVSEQCTLQTEKKLHADSNEETISRTNPQSETPRNINCHPTIMSVQVLSPFSTYRLFRDPCRTFPSLDPFHQLYPITCACSTCIISHRIFFRVDRGDPTRAVDGPIAKFRSYALFGELSHP